MIQQNPCKGLSESGVPDYILGKLLLWCNEKCPDLGNQTTQAWAQTLQFSSLGSSLNFSESLQPNWKTHYFLKIPPRILPTKLHFSSQSSSCHPSVGILKPPLLWYISDCPWDQHVTLPWALTAFVWTSLRDRMSHHPECLSPTLNHLHPPTLPTTMSPWRAEAPGLVHVCVSFSYQPHAWHRVDTLWKWN